MGELSAKLCAAWVAFAGVMARVPVIGWPFLIFASEGQMNIATLMGIFLRYQRTNFEDFMRSHWDAYKKGQETGNFVPGVCNYYRLMSDLITFACGPFWHFTPLEEGKTRMECHDQFHHTMSSYLEARRGEDILELGCGYGEIGRQVAKISGAKVVGLTMADEEIAGANQRIAEAGLEKQCRMVQGNYHKLPFEAQSFNKVFGVYTLKYSSDVALAVAEASRVLKPGGKFVSYEILVSDTYDPSNSNHTYLVDHISSSTCMPPLWSAGAMRDAASKSGLVLKKEVDLCTLPKQRQWYLVFEDTGIHRLMMSTAFRRLIWVAEACCVLPRSFTAFYDSCLHHPVTDFVLAGRMGIITGAVMMVWEKP